MEKIHLVTNNNLLSLSKDKKNILLGGWCYNYLNKSQYEKFNIEIIKTHSLYYCDRNKNLSNESQKLINKLIKDLNKFLNFFHNKNYDDRYWSLLISPWVNNFISTYIIIKERLKIISKNYIIDSASFYKKNNFELPKDYNEGVKFLGNDHDYFNSLTYEIFKNDFYNKNIKVNFIENTNNLSLGKTELRNHEKNNLKKIILKIILNLFKLFPVLNNKPFIIGSALPSFYEMLIKLSNLQSPQVIGYEKTINKRNDINNRIKSSLKPLEDNFQINDITKILLKYFPCSFIENYNLNLSLLKKISWPSKPKFIFTSVNHYFDDLFKLYCAEQVKNKVPLYLGQHGARFSTHIPYWNHPETYLADKFLVWGRKKISSNSFETFILRKPKIKQVKNNLKGGILFLIETAENITNLLNSKYDYQNENFDFQSKFVQQLDVDKFNSLILRLRNKETNKFCHEELRWREKFSTLNIELGEKPVFQMINQSKLTVFGYDSTGFLECISQNIPVILYIPKREFDKINSFALDDYKKLYEKKIIFCDPDSLNNHINNIWGNIDSWWYDHDIQKVIEQFKSNYCITEKFPIKKLNSIFNA